MTGEDGIGLERQVKDQDQNRGQPDQPVTVTLQLPPGAQNHTRRPTRAKKGYHPQQRNGPGDRIQYFRPARFMEKNRTKRNAHSMQRAQAVGQAAHDRGHARCQPRSLQRHLPAQRGNNDDRRQRQQHRIQHHSVIQPEQIG